VSLGGSIEAGDPSGLLARLGSNVWILAVFTGLFVMRTRIERLGHFALSWLAFFALLVTLGRMTEGIFA